MSKVSISLISATMEGDRQPDVWYTVIQLMDALAVRWTAKQAQAITGALLGWTQENIAQLWWDKPIAQQAVGKHLERAGCYAIENGLIFFETYINGLL